MSPCKVAEPKSPSFMDKRPRWSNFLMSMFAGLMSLGVRVS